MTSSETPLMRQWREAKVRHPDALLFFRVGDFYELFHGDAEEGARRRIHRGANREPLT